MDYRQLGHTELSVSRLGFGCWAIGGHGYGRIDDKISVQAIQKALDSGVNFFDTANVYGFGHSEEVLSKALGKRINEVIVATKFGINWDEDGHTFKDCSPARIVESLHHSLRRLKIDRIPLYQIHWYDGLTPLADIMGTLEKCRAEGKIGFVGCSNFSNELLKKAVVEGRLESIQLEYNLVKTNRLSDVLDCVHENRLGTVVYGALARGLFSGKFIPGVSFDENDTRAKDEYFQPIRLERVQPLIERLSQIGRKHNKTAAQVAIKWVLENEDITCAIVGIKNDAQLDENLGAIDWRLSHEDNAALALLARKITDAV